MSIRIPFFSEIIIIVAALLSILLVPKTNLRWQAIFKARKIKAFNISRAGWMKCVVYELIQIGFYFVILLMLLIYFDKGKLIGIMLVFYVLESIFHIILGVNLYKVIVAENAITMINSNLVIIPWVDVIGIVKRHNGFQFKLTNKAIKLIDLDFINLEERKEFQDKIKAIALKKNIFIEG